jgi:hypothetical protein
MTEQHCYVVNTMIWTTDSVFSSVLKLRRCSVCEKAFLAYFPLKGSETYEITSLSVCLSVCVCVPPNSF